MVTVKDVAKHAGVSPSTVSRVINGAKNVSVDIRAQVQDSVKLMGYFPNTAARNLVRRQAGAIVIMLRNLHSPFYTNLIRGIEDSAATCSRNIIFCSLGNQQEYRDRYIQFLTNGISDGIILYGTLFSDLPMIEHLSQVNFPFLLIENNFDTIPVNQMLVNNLDGASSAVEYLMQQGHTRIAHFMGDPNKKINLERLNGYTQVMQKYGVTIAEDYIKNISGDTCKAYAVAQELMKQPADIRPTAIFASNDEIAAQAILGITSLSFNVPEHMSVVGFDSQSIYNSGYAGPAITSVMQPLYQIGKDSIEVLSNILDGEQKTFYRKVYETNLVLQETVSKPLI